MIRTATALLGALAISSLAIAASEPGKPLTQGAWAAMLADRMGIGDASSAGTAGAAAAMLGGRGTPVAKDARSAQLLATDGSRHTWRYDISLPRSAMWTVEVKAALPTFVTIDKRPSSLAPAAPGGGFSDVGEMALSGGMHTAMVNVSQVPTAPDLLLVPGCHVVSPANGWQTSATLTYGALARTLVEATRQSSRLPAAEALAIAKLEGPNANIQTPGDGEYTLVIAGDALSRASYRLDSCQEERPAAIGTQDGWREGATTSLAAGLHTITIAGYDTTKTDARVRFVRRSSADNDYLAVLQSMGVKVAGSGMTHASLVRAHGMLMASLFAPVFVAAPQTSLTSLASQPVSAEDAQAILDDPAIAHYLANGLKFHKPKPEEKGNAEEDRRREGTFEQPVSPTVPGDQNPDPL